MNGCDTHWLDAHARLVELHARKSATYGNDGDRFFNFTAVSVVTGAVPERYMLQRIVEKATRAIQMIDAGDSADVREYPDIASLAIGCQAMLTRRALPGDLLPLDERRAS